MPRRGNIAKRDVLADPIYNSKMVTRLVNSVMLDGKKGVAQKIVYEAFSMIQEKTGNDPLETFEKAMENIMPSLECKTRRVGGANYQVPLEVSPARRETQVEWKEAAMPAKAPLKAAANEGPENLASHLVSAKIQVDGKDYTGGPLDQDKSISVVLSSEIPNNGLSYQYKLPDQIVIKDAPCRRTVHYRQRIALLVQHLLHNRLQRVEQLLLCREYHRIECHLVLVQNTLRIETRRIVESAQRTKPRMGHHDVGGGLFVQLLPVALVGGGDGNVTRTVALPAILYHEHHLPGFAGEPPFGPTHQLFRLLFVIHAPVEKHHPGELERVVEPADVPAVGLVRYGRNVHARYVGRNAVMAEHGLVLLVMDNRM